MEGKKLTKAQEKKLKRKEVLEKKKQSKQIIEEANKEEDVLQWFVPFKKYDRNGLDIEFVFYPIHKLPKELFDWLLDLFKENMQTMYEQSWGYNESKKKRELKAEDARYIIAFDRTSKKPVAFVHFRFEMDDDDEFEVLYCYEIQLHSSVQGKGLGKFMMQMLELIGRKYKMTAIMLTCLKINPRAMKFYMEHLNYKYADISPSKADPEHESEYDHEVLIKQFPKPTNTQRS